MLEMLGSGKIIFGQDHNKIVEIKVYAKNYLEKLPSVIELAPFIQHGATM